MTVFISWPTLQCKDPSVKWGNFWSHASLATLALCWPIFDRCDCVMNKEDEWKLGIMWKYPPGILPISLLFKYTFPHPTSYRPKSSWTIFGRFLVLNKECSSAEKQWECWKPLGRNSEGRKSETVTYSSIKNSFYHRHKRKQVMF